MATFRICGVQMQVGDSKKDNLPKILRHIEKCDCDFIVFPEMALTGRNNEFSEARTLDAWKQISAACRTGYVTAIVGTGARADGLAYIQSRIYRDDGELIGTHEKLVPTTSDRKWVRAGSELRVFRHMGLRLGCLIGNDLWVVPGSGGYPDSRLSYQLAQQGAQMIFHAADTGTDPRFAQYYESNLLLRAWESKLHIVTVNAAPAEGELNCPSGVIGPEGEWLVQAPRSGEQTFTCDLEIDID